MPDGDDIYFELFGQSRGPTGAVSPWRAGQRPQGRSLRRPFDPERYCILGIDQRGCGRSTPLASERPDRLGNNTNDRLIADIETIRAHLGSATSSSRRAPGAPRSPSPMPRHIRTVSRRWC